ncbi:MAG: endonuclease domain-containing protein [Balneola sp.]
MKADRFNNFGYNKGLRKFANKNRNNATKAEACLWKYALSKKKTGYTFKRQRPVLSYIVDFMCQELSLIIEVDGSSHDDLHVRINDLNRQMKLENAGFTVIRFSNEDVLKNMDEVRRNISEVVAKLGSGSSSL